MNSCMRRTLIQTCLLTAALALPAVAQGQFGYTTHNGATSITNYTGPGGAVTIPSAINGLPVTSIDYRAFWENSSLTSVTIPNSVTSIGESVFYSCSSLTNVTIPDSVINIGYAAFCGCTSLTNVRIGYSVTSIADGAFSICSSLTSVTIPNSVTSIGESAFHSCSSLTNVTIGNGVTSIADGAFSDCSSLTAITVDTNNPAYSSVNGVLFDKTKTTLVEYPGGLNGSYAIPDSVTRIGLLAFSECRLLTDITIGNNVINIGNEAFASCPSLTSVTIPNSVTNIGYGAFSGCASLTSVYFKGDSPAANGTVFVDYYFDGGVSYKATAYILPGTTGWDVFSANTGIPAMPWVPFIQTGDADFGVRTNQFGFNINWVSGQTVVIDALSLIHISEPTRQ